METREPRWLDADERDAWLALGAVMIRLPAALDTQMQRDSGISHFEYQVLAVLSEAPERTSRMSHLAMLANGSLSRISHVVKRLERHGWVTRIPNPDDRRYALARLTDAGREKVEASAPRHVEEVRRLVFDPLTKAQQRHLAEIGRRMLAAMCDGESSGS